MTQSWDASVFDRIHARAADPWDVETSAYERDKYNETLAALPRPHFSNALEIGCSIGAMTARLAERCDTLLALDIAAEAVRRTTVRCATLPHVTIRQAQIPRDWPPGRFDLIVISEVLYFFSPDDIARTAELALANLASDGAILLVNWTGFTDTPTTGNQAAELFIALAAERECSSVVRDKFRIDLLTERKQVVLF